MIPSSVLSNGALVALFSSLAAVVVEGGGGGDVEVEATGVSSSEATSGVDGSCSSDS